MSGRYCTMTLGPRFRQCVTMIAKDSNHSAASIDEDDGEWRPENSGI